MGNGILEKAIPLAAAGGIGIYFLYQFMKPKPHNAGIVSDNLPGEIELGEFFTAKLGIKNTGTEKTTFTVNNNAVDPNGKLHVDLSKELTLEPGETKTVELILFECVTCQMTHPFNVVGIWSWEGSVWYEDKLLHKINRLISCFTTSPIAEVTEIIIS